ncbi:MAG: hypothetical protein HY606_07150 [Planctomycetes bacterium]|nr:hypothetical protein [Planctomycetota bacterium]
MMVSHFKKWVDHIRAGELEEALKLTGKQMKSKWLYRIYENPPFNDFASKKYKELPKDLESLFDRWLTQANIQFITYKSLPPLPEAIEGSEWFLNLIKEHYQYGRDIILTEFKRMDILENYIEFNEGTIIVRSGDGAVQMYVMKIEDGGWKVDWNKPAPR